MEEISDNESNSEENESSNESETNDEPIINRSHKHNLRKKRKKVNYSESSKKSQSVSVNLEKKSESESEDGSTESKSDDESTENDSETISKKKSKKQSKKELKRKNSTSPRQIIKRVLIEIIQSLNFYWKEPDQNALISTILDPRYKDLKFLSDTLKFQTESRLHTIYDELYFELNPNDLLETTTETSIANEDSIFNTLFGSETTRKKANEIDVYLNENLTIKPGPNYNPYTWWNDHKKNFPILFMLARKFLSVPATSVPSERLFSDAGNNMTNNRTLLSSKVFQELLFIKRNSKYMDIFALLANKVNFLLHVNYMLYIK
jgi:hypothetical protein